MNQKPSKELDAERIHALSRQIYLVCRANHEKGPKSSDEDTWNRYFESVYALADCAVFLISESSEDFPEALQFFSNAVNQALNQTRRANSEDEKF